MKCAYCDNQVGDGAQCSLCKNEVGFCCAGITEQGYRKLGSDRRTTWKCHICKRDASPARAKPADIETVLQELREMKKQLLCLPGMVQDVIDIKTELSEVKESCNFSSAKLEEHSSRLVEVERKVSELEALQEKVVLQSNEISFINNEMSRNDQQQRLNNVEIKGVPVKKNENLFTILKDIGTVIGYQVEKNSINYISRVPMHKSKEKLIIVSFTNRYIKEDFIASARSKKKISADEIGFKDNKQSVFINDHLTPENKKLLTTTKTTLKQKGYQYVWVKYCKIHARKDDTSNVYIIHSERDLNKLV
ncbi:uncharacterized protein LOC134805790 [Cydia splendana]|uniref:uncharacterized protein LOC134805790 n=1 Tax=Cydia splendana TaxID=1100963 RepID=UPI0028F4B3DF